MPKSFICKGLSVVSGMKFVKLLKTMRWLTFFTTGEGPQQSPLTNSSVLAHIKKQVRDNVLARVAENRAAGEATPVAAVEDLADRLGLAGMGIADEDECEDPVFICKKTLKLMPKTLKVPLTILGAPADWAPVFAVDATVGTRMELTVENLTNLFTAFENEKPTRAEVAKMKKSVATPKRKQTASPATTSPKKKGTSPLPDNSPNSGHRRYAYKGVGVVRVIPGEAATVKIGVRTPRRYQVVNRKRRRNGDKAVKRSSRRNAAPVDTDSDQDVDDNVFEVDEDPDMDAQFD
jgi:hypothetical protein